MSTPTAGEDDRGRAPESRGTRLGVAVGGGPRTWQAVGTIRRLAQAGAQVTVTLGPGCETWIPRRTFAVASQSRVRSSRDGVPGTAPAGRVILAAGLDDLADLAAGRGWLASGLPAAAAAGPLMIVQPGDQEGPPWFEGPRRALASQGATWLEGDLEEEALVAAILAQAVRRDLVGATVLITAGPSREHLDPVRFFSNPSSGRMGIALALAAHLRGARVELCLGPSDAIVPSGISLHRFESARDLDALVQRLGPEADAVIAAAAVADWRPAQVSAQKLKKSGETQSVQMVRTPDVLARLSQTLQGLARRPFFVGFAAETEDLEANARKKLEAKGLDLVVANRVDGPEGAFAKSSSSATLVDAQGATDLPHQEKVALAHAVLDRVAARWKAREKEEA